MEDFCPDQIQQWMSFAFDFVNPARKAELDFSMESLALAGQSLGELKAGMGSWPREDFQRILNMVVLGWGAYIGETVRRCDPAWTWDFPEPSSGEFPQLVRTGPGGVGRLTCPAVRMALARLHEDELDIALLTRMELGKVRRLLAAYKKGPDPLDPRTARN